MDLGDDHIYVYRDGDPAQGQWVNLDGVRDWSDVRDALETSGLIGVDYGGDLLIADAEGELPHAFLRGYGTFDLDGYIAARDGLDELDDSFHAPFLAYIKAEPDHGAADFRDAYIGEFPTLAEFGEYMVENSGLLEGVADPVAAYFDHAAYGRDIVLDGGCWRTGDFYFWS